MNEVNKHFRSDLEILRKITLKFCQLFTEKGAIDSLESESQDL